MEILAPSITTLKPPPDLRSSFLLPPPLFSHSRSTPRLSSSFSSRFLFNPVRCSSSSSNDGPQPSSSSSSSNSWASHQWDEDNSKYLEAHVVDAVSLLPSQGHLFINLSGGAKLEIEPPNGFLFGSTNPSIVLKFESEGELFLPILVGNSAIDMLMSALHDDQDLVRPTQYHVMRDLVGALNFEVRMVRITQRVADTYLSRIYIARPGEMEMQSVDARPSDAVNLAVRCKAPIYVHKDIVGSDAVRPAANTDDDKTIEPFGDRVISILDRPSHGRDVVSEELGLLKKMVTAASEERYTDAAHWRNELNDMRRKRWRIRRR